MKTDVSDIWGVGYRYAVKLKEQFNIYTAWQLSRMNTEWAEKYGRRGRCPSHQRTGMVSLCVEMKDPLEIKK